MFSHITVGTNDMDAARRFYDALFAAMGARPGVFDEKGRLLYFKDGRMFGVTAPIDGQPACHANGGTIGFTLDSAEAVRGWQDAGVAHGGTAIEDPAGIRSIAGRQLFLAYLRDPDGNKLCAVHVMS
ncbi:TPA: VOC family protein [Stenotrophomonas maltophilia]|uniref:VOC family protein n=1 Tax=Stenotrophomonas maltophilia TaxID=40324 RepID=UPI00165894A9|nr:VOC family protein [Stenotrophomonas maltophilia]MBC9117563.1 VOC family protein [Stenotrophomonas maltophilia]MCU1086060.1 VOC family protein [Stenotrophomonas maltophilia]MCU1161044.1 VOC family protein [Stenotrophomonas maltophilia]HEL3008572.1 VOC family protein [Stenotrophomonas maltophilia]HEL4206159.1 VOC family protein [Stenotrophomonas maltophilia]